MATIHQAERASGPSGVVLYGPELDLDAAVARRQSGQDVVVRGSDPDENRRLAGRIETAAGPTPLRQTPHRRAGPQALPHWQQEEAPGRAHLLRDGTPQGKETAMRYFTAELLERYRSNDPDVARTAEAEWETVHSRYEQAAQALEAELPPSLRELATLLLHDAVVQSLGRDGQRLLMVLRQDIPPRDLVVLGYDLEAEPVLTAFARRPREWRLPARFDFDELDRLAETPAVYRQSIVFDNGWEMQLRFRDVQVWRGEPWTPPLPVVTAPVPLASQAT